MTNEAAAAAAVAVAVWDIVKKPTQQRGTSTNGVFFSKEKKKKVTRKSDVGTRSANKSAEKKAQRHVSFRPKISPLFFLADKKRLLAANIKTGHPQRAIHT